MTIGPPSASSPTPDRESRLHLLGIVLVTIAMIVGGFIVTIRRDDATTISTATPVATIAPAPTVVPAP